VSVVVSVSVSGSVVVCLSSVLCVLCLVSVVVFGSVSGSCLFVCVVAGADTHTDNHTKTITLKKHIRIHSDWDHGPNRQSHQNGHKQTQTDTDRHKQTQTDTLTHK
jgi:hypothetical protein